MYARETIDRLIYCTYNNMDITYDSNKDANNRRKHGISLAEAAKIDWVTALEGNVTGSKSLCRSELKTN